MQHSQYETCAQHSDAEMINKIATIKHFQLLCGVQPPSLFPPKRYCIYSNHQIVTEKL